MKRLKVLFSLVMIMAIVLPTSVTLAGANGVDDLRGRWDIEWRFENNPQPPLILYINDLVEAPFIAQDAYLAGGCMRSPDTDAFMPLSMLAFYNPDNKTYDVSIYSTVVPPEEWDPFVIRFQGTIEVNGKGVPDDIASGDARTDFASGTWDGTHHDRRKTKCPGIGSFNLGVQADVYAHKDLAYTIPKHYTLLEAHTVIVSSGMLVEAPDGSTMVVQEYTDIFSPDVDFIGRFRYLTHFESAPISSGVYNFVLLDIFGNPIPGTESTDIWTGCEQEAPSNLEITYTSLDDVILSWAAVPDILGQFEPSAYPQIGFYQIGISPFNWEGEKNYGANGIRSPEHLIPRAVLDPGQDGYPDGWDYGWPLTDFDDGVYQVLSEAFGEPLPESGGFGHECSVYNSAEQLMMHKQGDNISFEKLATISGRVTDLNGVGLAEIEIGACDYFNNENGFCGGDLSDENGFYTIVLPEGTYRVEAHPGSGYLHEFYYETTDWDQAAEVQTPGVDINFTLAPAGSISGTVLTGGTDPVIDIWVDACHESVPEHEWGQSPLCYGAPTDENGYYQIDGIQVGNYRMVIWGDEVYIAQFYTDSPTYDEATLVPVVAGQTTEYRNFNLTTAGSISGFVTADGNALIDIWVDACHESVPEHEWGQSPLCYGAPTNENGYYEIHGITPGDYRVVTWGTEELGHEFYNEVQDYLNATLVVVNPGETFGGVNFTLKPPPPDILIIAHPDHNWIMSHNWTAGENVNLIIEGNSWAETAVATGEVWFDWEDWGQEFDLLPGMVVEITNGTLTDTLEIESLIISQFDESTSLVGGVAPAGREVGIGVHQPTGDFWMVLTADESTGEWTADFSPEIFDSVFDIHAMIWDDDGDATQANYDFPP
ncbi:MAG: hypothetical protein GY755_20565 [Chloroflexi bacterium]|nr:hypothetical protein [Chloroflexota bacterium]